jgi:hypothetical protein
MRHPILCVGGPAHGKMADDVGSFLRVVDSYVPSIEIKPWPRLKHGPGYRRLPRFRFEPLRCNLVTYVLRRFVRASGAVVTIYACEDLSDRELICQFNELA